jgi:hypothetical protein
VNKCIPTVAKHSTIFADKRRRWPVLRWRRLESRPRHNWRACGDVSRLPTNSNRSRWPQTAEDGVELRTEKDDRDTEAKGDCESECKEGNQFAPRPPFHNVPFASRRRSHLLFSPFHEFHAFVEDLRLPGSDHAAQICKRPHSAARWSAHS